MKLQNHPSAIATLRQSRLPLMAEFWRVCREQRLGGLAVSG
jgi:hypothetical protein